MKLLFYYIKSYGKYYSVSALFIIIIAVVLNLYNVEIAWFKESIFYSIILYILAVVIFFVADFWSFYKKVYNLKYFEKEVDLNNIPDTDDYIENIFMEIIINMNKKHKKLITDYEKKMQDSFDYYSLWVHQIKTPISAIDLLLSNNEITVNTNDLKTELFKIEQYVEMVLIYYRIGSQNNDLLILECPIDDIIKKALRKYAKLFISSKVSLEYKPLGIFVLTDEKWFLYVMEQIISNAVKYNINGLVKIYIEDENILVIEDSGIGIIQNDIPLIFDKGYTGFNGHINQKSTGLGLYLTKKILDMLSHKITIESEIDKGTKVKIDLKRYDLETE